MDEHNQTIRQAVIEAASQFNRIDAAVFTTFNFSPVFFENNILPALFGFEGASEGVRRTMVNLKLAETDVCVFYDASTRPKDSGIYRYQSAGLVLPKRFFHPKMIIMAGTGVQNGAMQVYLAVMSANMSMAGWGKNAEVYADMWLGGADQINCNELISAIEWLGQRFQGIGSARIPALSRILEGIGQLSKAKSPQDEQRTYFYFSPIHPKGFFHFITKQSGVSQWEELMVFSPYWSDVPANIQKAGAHQTTLVPAFIPSNKSYGLGKQQLEDLTRVNLMRLAKGDDIRLWHAKAYEFRSKTSCWVASGSSNFTFNGLAGGEAGNVEAMLVCDYPLRGRGDHFPELVDLAWALTRTAPPLPMRSSPPEIE